MHVFVSNSAINGIPMHLGASRASIQGMPWYVAVQDGARQYMAVHGSAWQCMAVHEASDTGGIITCRIGGHMVHATEIPCMAQCAAEMCMSCDSHCGVLDMLCLVTGTLNMVLCMYLS